MKHIKQTFVLFLCIILALNSIIPAYAGSTTATTKLYSTQVTYYLDMWHYSGNYWIIGSGSDKTKVSDKEIDRLGGLENYLNANYTSVDFSVQIPDVVKKAIANGEEVTADLETCGCADWREIFDKKTLHVTSDVDSPSGKYEFNIRPIFHLVSGRDFTDFVPGLSQSIPLIDYKYGKNIYSVFGNGKTAVQVNGSYVEASMRTVETPYLHPLMIADTSGRLAGGHVISVSGKNVASDGYSVGSGTFAASGAVGISFCFPVNVVFYKATANTPGTGTVTPVVTEDDNGGGDDDDIDPDPDPVSGSLTVKAHLDLPRETYEGRTVIARDVSDFYENKTYIDPLNAYKDGLAENSFDAPDARKGTRTSVEQELKYNDAGTYPVTLTVETKGGAISSDSKCITVLPCPAVSASVGGTQKQNRRQVLTVNVMQHPNYPVKSLTITISEPVSGEKITVSRNFSGAQASPANSAHIKYRSLKDGGSDSECIVSSIEFLSKFGEDRQFTYTVTASDSRGKTDTRTGSFTVVKDTPPVAKISLADSYYRQENSNTAVIEMSDASEGSGNFERTWTYEGTAFKDLSGGTGKTVSFEREGVGPFSVTLKIKDLWSEETLEEYVTDADHLTAAASASSKVDNIAPVVSFDMKADKTAQMLLLAENREVKRQLENTVPALKAKLAEEGINAEVAVALQSSKGVTASGNQRLAYTLSQIFDAAGGAEYLSANQTSSTFWTAGHAAADEEMVYFMDSANVSPVPNVKYKQLTRDYPYTIKASDMSGAERWTYTLSESTFASPTGFSNAEFGHDAQGRYLYLVSDGRTLILDKSDGSLVRIVGTALGTENYVLGSTVYSITSGGIYRLDGSSCTLIYPASVMTGSNMTRLFGGRECFTEKKDDGVYYSRFNPADEKVISVKLDVPYTAQCMAIDTRGYAVMAVSSTEYRAFDTSGKQVGSTVLSSGAQKAVPCFDGSGHVNYICGTYRERVRSSGETAYINYAFIGSLFSSYRSEARLVGSGENYRCDADILYAVENGEGIVSAILPAGVYPLSYTIYRNMLAFNFDTKKNTHNFGSLIASLPPTQYSGWFEGGTYITDYNTGVNSFAQVFRISESEKDETARLRDKWLAGGADYTTCSSVSSGYTLDSLVKLITDQIPAEKEAPAKHYARGQKIDYKVFYSDHENDPSKYSVWVYTHSGGKDGIWDKSGVKLSSPVTSFDKEGKYVLTHWQCDSAGRGLTEEYDKESKPCTMVFYITGSGGDGNETPKVKDIRTDSAVIYVGDEYSVIAEVNDDDGDSLDVTVEIYHGDDTEPIASVTKKGIVPGANGKYPEVNAGNIPKADIGKYKIVVTVSDGSASDVDSISFTPKIRSSLKAEVDHTEYWESNRQNFNYKYFKKTGADLISDYASYKTAASPRIRGKNVFWPGEKLELYADISGDVSSVKAELVGFGWNTVLTEDTGAGSAWNHRYTGSLYNSAMQTKLAEKNPRLETVRFTAVYKDGSSRTFEVDIIFDYDIGYWMLHRTK